jgi:hypothetical protein
MNIFDSSGHFQNAIVFSLNRSDFENCQGVHWVYWYNIYDPGTGWFGSDYRDQPAFAIAPAHQDESASAAYLIDSYSNGGCNMTLFTMTGNSVQDSSLSMAGRKISTQCYSGTVTAQQKGSSITVDAGSSSISQAELRNGLVSVMLTSKYNWNCDGDDDVIDWFNINPTSGNVASQGSVGYPCYYYYYPSMAMQANGSFVVSYAYSSTGAYPSAATFGYSPSGGYGTNLTFGGGLGPYTTRSSNCGNCARWGDYSSARIDPSNGNQIWVVGEWSSASNTWNTQIAAVQA